MKSYIKFQHIKVEEDINTQIRELSLLLNFCPLLLIETKSSQEHSLKYIPLIYIP